jgi:hypothetical protein
MVWQAIALIPKEVHIEVLISKGSIRQEQELGEQPFQL